MFYSSSADTYYVSWGFVAGFADDPTPLWGCDAGRIVRETEYGFYVESPDASDLLYLLGLRDGDEVISINGYDLGTFDDAFYAYVVLWELQGEYQYTLQVQRGTAVVELNYYLYAA